MRSEYGVENAGPNGVPGLGEPSNSIVNMPLEDSLLACRGRVWLVEAGGVWLARRDSVGGWNGPEAATVV